jgi:hypothetical protein
VEVNDSAEPNDATKLQKQHGKLHRSDAYALICDLWLLGHLEGLYMDPKLHKIQAT